MRRTAPAGVLAWTDREQEYAVLRALAGRGLPVPGGARDRRDERPFLVMERLPGGPPARLSPEERRALGRELGTLLARLHALDPRELGLADGRLVCRGDARAGTPVPASSTSPRGRARCRSSARSSPGRSGTSQDDETPPAVLWGDPGAHNLLVADGRITALLDWELTHVGDPLDDLGAAVWSCLGSFDPDDVVAGYEEVAGPVDRQRLSYFVALACATRSVMVVNGTAAWIDGLVTAPANAALGLELLALDLARGARAAGWGDLPLPDGKPPDYPLRPDAAESARGVARWLLAGRRALGGRPAAAADGEARGRIARGHRRPHAVRSRPRRGGLRARGRRGGAGVAATQRSGRRCCSTWPGRSTAWGHWRRCTGIRPRYARAARLRPARRRASRRAGAAGPGRAPRAGRARRAPRRA